MQIIDLKQHQSIPPVLRLGFRPFFLGGAAFALAAVLLWLIALNGLTSVWQPAGGWLGWHRHEMFFGFATAIIAGFLLTAVQNWTGRPGLAGKPLGWLAALWLAARLAWLANAPGWLLLPLELAFLPVVMVVLGRPIWQVRQVRNYPVLLVLLVLTGANAMVTAGVVSDNATLQQRGGLAAVWVIVTLLGLIGGRVIPFFTRRGLDLKGKAEDLRWVDWLALGGGLCMAGLTAAGLADRAHGAMAVLCFSLALGHCFRVVHWYDQGIWRVPLLWSLHLAYAWLVVGLFGLGLWQAGVIAAPSLPLHALTMGAMGGAILAMVARVTLGHTGRQLLPPAAMGPAFALLNAGVVARVGVAALWPAPGLALAGLCWALAFAIFLWHYAPMLVAARVDGHPG